jgi:flagellar hook-basal body complex protein FliE
MKASLALASALAALLLLAPPPTARADTTVPSSAQQPAGDDFAAKKDAYLKQMHSQMHEWGDKIDQYSEDAKAKGDAASREADKDLHRAWVKTKEASVRLAHATDKGWDKAKAAFEHASDKMNHAWQDYKPQ